MISIKYDVIIIGTGPAGMTACLYASRANLRVLMLEGNAPGGKLINTHLVENFPSHESITGVELAQKMFSQSQKFGGIVKFERCESIVDKKQYKEVITKNNTYLTKVVIIATGMKSRKLGVKGEDELFGKGLSYCAVCDGAFHKGKPVALIGGGNSAVEEGVFVSGFASKVYIIQLGDKLTAEQIIIENAKKIKNIEIRLNTKTLEIIGSNKVEGIKIENTKTKKSEIINVSGVFPYIGYIPITNFVKDLKITNEQGFIETNDFMETKIKGIFAIGDVRHKSIRQITTATSDGTIAGQIMKNYIENMK